MLDFIKRRMWGGAHGAIATFTLPPVVFEIAPGFVAGAGIELSRRKGRKVRAVALESIQPKAVDPHLMRANVTAADDLTRAAANLISTVGTGEGRYGLVVPDGAVRVAILSFESLPESPVEAEALIRWRMKDKLPFNSDEARATFQVLSEEPGRIEILALAMRTSVIAEYEAPFARLNGGAELIVPAAVALLPLLPQGETRVQLLINVCRNWLTVVVLSGARPCAWRTRELDPRDIENYSREIASESARVLASARERSGEGLGRAWLCARPPAEKDLTTAITTALDHEVIPLRPGTELSSLLPAGGRSVFEQFGATVAGLVANLN